MEYLATFHTHYGAMSYGKFCQRNGIQAKMMPAPRNISASCGTCVCFAADFPPALSEHEDMERCYLIAGDEEYVPVDG